MSTAARCPSYGKSGKILALFRLVSGMENVLKKYYPDNIMVIGLNKEDSLLGII